MKLFEQFQRLVNNHLSLFIDLLFRLLVGFNVETVTPAPGINFTVWDIGGQHQIRSLYAHYYDKTDGLLFVVDSADRDRIQEARDELFGIINHSHMLSIPIVVLANKMDLPTAMKPSELIEQLNLHSISRQRWFVQSACALTGDGIIEGMQQLSNMIKDRKKSAS